MPDTKISALAAVTTLAGTEEFVLATAGTNKKITAANLAGTGKAQLHTFAFNYNDAGLNNGIAFYTPTVGEVIVNLATNPTVTWDGTNPRMDIGQGTTLTGLYNDAGINPGGFHLAVPQPSNDGIVMIDPGCSEYGTLYVVTTTAPLKVWVSQDGMRGSAAPGATQGTATIYWVTVKP